MSNKKEIEERRKLLKEVRENPNLTPQEKFCFLVDICNLDND